MLVTMTKPSIEPVSSMNDSFMQKYCQKHQCPPEDFAVRVLWHCIHRYRRPLAWLIWLYHADFFQSDLELIEHVKDATTCAKIRDTVKFFSKQPSTSNFLRRVLKVRLSRSQLLKLAAAELGESNPAANPDTVV
jgi:hypothetical protein